MINHTELAQQINDNNVAVGWWKELQENPDLAKFYIPMKLCLVHSEITEAYLGWMDKDLDDHLPQYPMFHVEVADTAIRTYDLLGWFGTQVSEDKMQQFSVLNSTPGEFLVLHHMVTEALECHRKGRQAELESWLVTLIYRCWAVSRIFKFDLEKVINDKLEYNAQRLDHKLENRNAEGGKAI